MAIAQNMVLLDFESPIVEYSCMSILQQLKWLNIFAASRTCGIIF